MSKYNKVRGILKAQTGLQFPLNMNNLWNKIQSNFWNNTVGLTSIGQFTNNPYITLGVGLAQSLPEASITHIFPENTFNTNDVTTDSNSKKILNKIGTTVMDPKIMALGFDMIGSMFGLDVVNSKGIDTAFGTIDTIGNAAMSINPGVGAMIKGVGAAGKMINDLTGSRTRKFTINQDVRKNQGASYTGSYAFMDKYALYADKKIGGFSFGLKNSIDDNLDISENILDKITKIDNTNQDYLAMSGNDLNYLRYGFELNGGYDQRYMKAAKQGAKLEGKINFIKERRNKINSIINLDSKEIEWLPTIVEEIGSFKEGGIIESSEEWTPTIVIEEWEPTIVEYKDGGTLEVEEWEPVIVELEESVEGFKQGGKTKEESDVPKIEETTLKNIIPEGALHKNKHHIEHTDGLTLKGIPVVDNDGKQQAEVECEEIIFTLEVTKALEERYHKYYSDELTLKEKDELAIEAGKLLVREILYNTDDRANLIEKCEKGGKL